MYQKSEQKLNEFSLILHEFLRTGFKLTIIFLISALLMLLCSMRMHFSAFMYISNYVKEYISVGALIILESFLGCAILKDRIKNS